MVDSSRLALPGGPSVDHDGPRTRLQRVWRPAAGVDACPTRTPKWRGWMLKSALSDLKHFMEWPSRVRWLVSAPAWLPGRSRRRSKAGNRLLGAGHGHQYWH